ncbi:hypothetical protein [Nonomuraea sp. NPDC048916]|uniref:hypothetical protein n=1 Tax=Nonomuraea sp. NPDC048916 TaxID=3154232 RepID=UPI0033E30620
MSGVGGVVGVQRADLRYQGAVAIGRAQPRLDVAGPVLQGPCVASGALPPPGHERARAVATRYDKLAVRYEATALVAAINEWL